MRSRRDPSGIPPAASTSGAFRLFCSSGQLLKDDPLVYPGQPGVSHLHQFFGNTGTNGNSDYASLRTSGGTTCGKSDAPANRSSYWFPAMLDGVGHVVKPDYVKLYYKEVPSSSADCQPAINPNARGLCVGMPNGIRFIWGYNMKTGTSGPTDTTHIGADGIRFECWATATAASEGRSLPAITPTSTICSPPAARSGPADHPRRLTGLLGRRQPRHRRPPQPRRVRHRH